VIDRRRKAVKLKPAGRLISSTKGTESFDNNGCV
jgi:hypothetical protein